MAFSGTYRLFALALGVILLLQACDNTVDPVVPGDADPFAVYGFLDTAADTQFVRVSSVHARPAEHPDALRPVVRSTNLNTDEQVTWSDSLLLLHDGSVAVIYYSDTDADTGATYRLDVAGADGDLTRAFTTVPSHGGFVPGQPQTNAFSDVQQRVTWLDVDRVERATMHYTVRLLPSGRETTVELDYLSFGVYNSNGWRADILLQRDYRLLRRDIEPVYGDTILVLQDMRMSIDVPSEEWTLPEDGTNIENGSGFFGSVARFTESWRIDDELLRTIGYYVPE